MKKIISIALAACLAVTALAVAGCSEIESGNKIERMVMTLEFYDANNNVVDTKNVQIKLYTNYAPETTKAFKKLCESGFYDGTCIYNVQSNWLEFGKFSYDNDGKLVETEAYKNAEAIKGEFSKNGWVGNRLTTQKAALIMKRDYDNGTDKKYDTAKGAVIVAMNSVSTFPSDKYCVFGMICDDDEKLNPSVKSENSDLVNRSGLTSYAVIATVKDLRQTEDLTMTYYYDPATVSENAKFVSGLYTKTVDEVGITHYYRGTEVNEQNVMSDEDASDFATLLADQANFFYTVPYTRVLVKKIVKKA